MLFVSDNFSPGWSVIGGFSLGLAVTLYLVLNGRLAGFSGLFKGLLFSLPQVLLSANPSVQMDWAPRAGFFSAFLATGMVGNQIAPHVFGGASSTEGSTLRMEVLFCSGLLVGVGTCIGNGCTSGHGICGIARFSKRSLFGTVVFFVLALTIALISRQLLATYLYVPAVEVDRWTKASLGLQITTLVLTVILFVGAMTLNKITPPASRSEHHWKAVVPPCSHA